MTMFGKEKSGRVCCLGRTKTPTLLKRNIEIKKRHANEVKELNDKIQEIKGKSRKEMAAAEEKRSQEMAAMDQKFQILLKTVLNQNDSKFNVAALISTPANANSGLHSSTSTHAPINEDWVSIFYNSFFVGCSPIFKNCQFSMTNYIVSLSKSNLSINEDINPSASIS